MTEEYDRLQKRIDMQEAELNALRAEVQRMKEDAQMREIARLKWGVGALGTVVLVLGGWIWTQIGHIFDFRGRP